MLYIEHHFREGFLFPVTPCLILPSWDLRLSLTYCFLACEIFLNEDMRLSIILNLGTLSAAFLLLGKAALWLHMSRRADVFSGDFDSSTEDSYFQLAIKAAALPEAELFYFIIYVFIYCFLQGDPESGADDGHVVLFQGFIIPCSVV